MDDFDFIAPTGAELQGTSEEMSVAYPIRFTGEDRSWDYTGGDSKDYYEGAEQLKVAGAGLFMCEDGEDWMEHHLIPAGADPLTDETLEAFVKEEQVGRLLDALKAASFASQAAGVSLVLAHRAVEDTQILYDKLKARSIELRDRDLATQVAAAELAG